MSLESITIITEFEEIVLVNSVLRPTGLDSLIQHLEHGLHSKSTPITHTALSSEICMSINLPDAALTCCFVMQPWRNIMP